MVGRVVAASILDAEVNERVEILLRLFESCRAMNNVKVKNHTSIRIFGPSQKTFIILFYQSNGPVNYICLVVFGGILPHPAES